MLRQGPRDFAGTIDEKLRDAAPPVHSRGAIGSSRGRSRLSQVNGAQRPIAIVHFEPKATRAQIALHRGQGIRRLGCEQAVAHPRWSQASEELIGRNGERRPTLLFNGYGDYVAHMYKGLEQERLWV